MSARIKVTSATLPSGSSVEAWEKPTINTEHVYQTMPPLVQEDADALERSIRTHGIQTPIIVDELGNIIDGHHRREIAERCGLPIPVEVRRGLGEATKVALSISLNVDRRQLSREQKREITAKSLVAQPQMSDRQHAERTGVAHTTVARIRDELESTGALHQSTTRISADGRERPATQPERPVVSITHRQSESTTETFDADTGEAVGPTVSDILDADPTLQDKQYVVEFYKALKRAGDYRQFDAERIGRLANSDDFRTLELEVQATQRFLDTMRSAAGLRLIAGGKK